MFWITEVKTKWIFFLYTVSQGKCQVTKFYTIINFIVENVYTGWVYRKSQSCSVFSFCSFSKTYWWMTIAHGVLVASRLFGSYGTDFCFYKLSFTLTETWLFFSSPYMLILCYFNHIKLLVTLMTFYIHEIWVQKDYILVTTKLNTLKNLFSKLNMCRYTSQISV